MARLSLSLLGPLRITLGGQPVSGFVYHKARALLVYLAVESDRPHQRDALVGLLWPDVPDPVARTNLRQVLTNLRKAIGDANATPPSLQITGDTIQFNPASDYELDVATLTALLAACETHAHRHLARCRSCAARMQQAIARYRGDFLAEFTLGDSAPFEEWQLRQRERLHQKVLDALVHLADYHERRGEDDHARRYAQRQIELDPWREEAHRQLMRLLARNGQRTAALAQYATCCRILERDLGVEPEAETTAFYERIRDTTSTELAAHRDEARHVQNFPAQTTALIGRESELAELGTLLENPARRLITVVGPGGIGKTRLALAAGNEQAEVFADGAVFVPLQALSSAAFLAPAILAALNIGLQGQRDPCDQMLDALRNKELLLVLDNFEQLLTPDQSENQSGAALLTDILHHAPGVTLLVTSRERLALHGEWLFDLAGLNYPLGELTEGLEGYSAVQLFAQRAGQVRRHFVVAEGEARAVSRICRLVEGLPLAIELAAAALRTRSCTAIADAIETNLAALVTGLRDLPERQRSMWATFEHSWRLLSEEERQVFARLSVFRGGFQEEAATQIAEATPQLLAALIDKSLLRWDGVARYDLHELVRQYAREKLEQAGEAGVLRIEHAAYFLELAEAAESKLSSAEQGRWLERLEGEHDNLRAALAWSLQALKPENEELSIRSNQPEGLYSIAQKSPDSQSSLQQAVGLRLVAALARFWEVRGYRKVRALLADSVVLFDQAGDSWGRAHVRCMLGAAAAWDGDFLQATALLEQGLALSQALGYKRGCARTFQLLAEVELLQGNYARAAAHAQEALAFYRELGDRHRIAGTLHVLADVTREQGEYARAIALFEECQVLYRELDDLTGLAGVCGGLGDVLLNQGDATGAAASFQQAVILFRALKHQDLPLALRGLGRALQEQGDDVGAFGVLVESLTSCRELGLKYAGGVCLAAMAGVWLARVQPVRAARLFGASQALRGTNTAPIGAVVYYTRDVASVRAQLDEATFEAAWAEGLAMPLEQAIAYALEGSEVNSASSTATAAPQ